uniref:COMM domain-containing protein n=1 Tax=Mucochytrium quahogii TaxID=96639 RepID=A0A7S2RRJ0_9STRA|mmetsp:Transcript_6985/g.11084  ORF Transcript_6985/g.11084 Transcript_6985/m.11084 type:complete len:178 (+) Transcript_6985:155-688(+)|eukprot:CAMPEP_0203771814 /NCGR_PEP_ID=MMETSP0099_2-20121227/3635_1 /ASSEMBLY_ACC=CAM_ASM_000209 /TAXON_ID=96639 /ORGANISM=" , Strain NY0313808BC1" /LENGTH=177 /DNA_ID=CAMNT_0050669223 /DNA_START=87 /DNA_END=620 /DNA_ORIENTATION=-
MDGALYGVLVEIGNAFFLSNDWGEKSEEIICVVQEKLLLEYDDAHALVYGLRQRLVRASSEEWPSDAITRKCSKDMKAEHVEALAKYWGKERDRLCRAFVEKTCVVTPRYCGVGWRVDVATKQQPGSQEEATAIVQLKAKNCKGVRSDIRFEMNKASLLSFNSELDKLNQSLEELKS